MSFHIMDEVLHSSEAMLSAGLRRVAKMDLYLILGLT